MDLYDSKYIRFRKALENFVRRFDAVFLKNASVHKENAFS